jgi:predicted nucleic acid-binding protein
VIRWVIDASALVDLMVVARPAQQLRVAFRYDRRVTPEIMDLDAAALLSRLVDRGELPEREARQVLRDVGAAPVQRFPHGPLLPRVWPLRGHTSVYGAAYLALAEILGVSLLTSDSRLEEAYDRRAAGVRLSAR